MILIRYYLEECVKILLLSLMLMDLFGESVESKRFKP